MVEEPLKILDLSRTSQALRDEMVGPIVLMRKLLVGRAPVCWAHAGATAVSGPWLGIPDSCSCFRIGTEFWAEPGLSSHHAPPPDTPLVLTLKP